MTEGEMLRRDAVRAFLRCVTVREAFVMQLRYGLNGNGFHTLKEVGLIMGLTAPRIRQIEVRALQKMLNQESKVLLPKDLA